MVHAAAMLGVLAPAGVIAHCDTSLPPFAIAGHGPGRPWPAPAPRTSLAPTARGRIVDDRLGIIDRIAGRVECRADGPHAQLRLALAIQREVENVPVVIDLAVVHVRQDLVLALVELAVAVGVGPDPTGVRARLVGRPARAGAFAVVRRAGRQEHAGNGQLAGRLGEAIDGQVACGRAVTGTACRGSAAGRGCPTTRPGCSAGSVVCLPCCVGSSRASSRRSSTPCRAAATSRA